MDIHFEYHILAPQAEVVRSTVDEQREFSASQAQIIQQQIQRQSSPHQLQHQVVYARVCVRTKEHQQTFLPRSCIHIPFICHFFTQTKFLENKIYTKKTRKLRQNTQ